MKRATRQLNAPVYEERLSSFWTELLFIALAGLFLLLFILRLNTIGSDTLSFVFFCFFFIFLFYSLNYRNLIIRIYTDRLKLAFGLFSMTIPLENIADCQLDDLPAGLRMGGAGIHLMFVRTRYRISFNFLEHPRVVLPLKQKIGPVRDVSFSTLNPSKVIALIHKADA